MQVTTRGSLYSSVYDIQPYHMEYRQVKNVLNKTLFQGNVTVAENIVTSNRELPRRQILGILMV